MARGARATEKLFWSQKIRQWFRNKEVDNFGENSFNRIAMVKKPPDCSGMKSKWQWECMGSECT